MKKNCCIVGACAPGQIAIANKENTLIIAADGGLHYLEQQSIIPDLIVGDFDSLGRVPEGENILLHPIEKDDTDTMLAVKLGLERGCTTFVLYGCSGGRPDHAYANYQTLLFLAEKGAQGYLVGDGWVSCAIMNSEISFPSTFSGTISVFCPDGTAQGVSLTGLYYTLENGTLKSGFPLGVSNHFTGEAACISVHDGALLIMWEETAENLSERIG